MSLASTLSILEGNTFVVSDRRGDIDASPTEMHGLFDDDVRHLSRWVLTVDGARPAILSTDDVEYYEAQFFLTPASGTIYLDSDLSISVAARLAMASWRKSKIVNHSSQAVTLDLRVEAEADFADLFEVKDALAKKGQHYRRLEGRRIVFGYRRERYMRETWITAAGEASLDGAGLTFHVALGPHGRWSTSIDVHPASAQDVIKRAPTVAPDRSRRREKVEHALAAAPRIVSSWLPLVRTYRRSVVDLAALRFFPPDVPGEALPAAGLPWFMTLFGRDSIVSSLQALPFTPELARTTLVALGASRALA